MSENLKEAKFSMTRWINTTAEDSMTDVHVDDNSGRPYRFSWEEAFVFAKEDAFQNIMDWVNDYELTYDEMGELENWLKELRYDTFQKELDKLEYANKEERIWEARLGLI